MSVVIYGLTIQPPSACGEALLRRTQTDLDAGVVHYTGAFTAVSVDWVFGGAAIFTRLRAGMVLQAHAQSSIGKDWAWDGLDRAHAPAANRLKFGHLPLAVRIIRTCPWRPDFWLWWQPCAAVRSTRSQTALLKYLKRPCCHGAAASPGDLWRSASPAARPAPRELWGRLPRNLWTWLRDRCCSRWRWAPGHTALVLPTERRRCRWFAGKDWSRVDRAGVHSLTTQRPTAPDGSWPAAVAQENFMLGDHHRHRTVAVSAAAGCGLLSISHRTAASKITLTGALLSGSTTSSFSLAVLPVQRRCSSNRDEVSARYPTAVHMRSVSSRDYSIQPQCSVAAWQDAEENVATLARRRARRRGYRTSSEAVALRTGSDALWAEGTQ